MGAEQAMRKCGYELKRAVRELSSLIWFFLLLLGYMDVHKKYVKFDVKMFFRLDFYVYFTFGRLFFSLPR